MRILGEAFAFSEAACALWPILRPTIGLGARPLSARFKNAARPIANQAPSKRLKDPTAMVPCERFRVTAIGHRSKDYGTHTGTAHTHTKSKTK